MWTAAQAPRAGREGSARLRGPRRRTDGTDLGGQSRVGDRQHEGCGLQPAQRVGGRRARGHPRRCEGPAGAQMHSGPSTLWRHLIKPEGTAWGWGQAGSLRSCLSARGLHRVHPITPSEAAPHGNPAARGHKSARRSPGVVAFLCRETGEGLWPRGPIRESESLSCPGRARGRPSEEVSASSGPGLSPARVLSCDSGSRRGK